MLDALQGELSGEVAGGSGVVVYKRRLNCYVDLVNSVSDPAAAGQSSPDTKL